MKKHEILKASEEYVIKLYGPLGDSADEQSHFIAGAEMVNENQPYSTEDALKLTKFAITMLASNLSYNVAKDKWLWWNGSEWINITDNELIKLWEESK